MAQYPTQSHYADTELTSPYPIQIMPSARLGGGKYGVGQMQVNRQMALRYNSGIGGYTLLEVIMIGLLKC